MSRLLINSASCRTAILRRSFHFASPSYHAALGNLPAVSRDALRAAALRSLDDGGDGAARFADLPPVSSLLAGETLGAGTPTPTINAMGETNGTQLLATADELQRITLIHDFDEMSWREKTFAVLRAADADGDGVLDATEWLHMEVDEWQE